MDSSLTLKQWFGRKNDKALERIRSIAASRNIPPMTDDEYKAAQLRQFARIAEEQALQFKPDYARIGIREDDLSLDWSDIKPGYSDGHKAVGEIKAAFERGHGMILIWGNYGQAKTLLETILTVKAFKAGKRAAYANMSAVMDNIRLAYDEKEGKTTELVRRMDWWIGRDVLCIDELDKCNSTPWAFEKMFRLLDQRYTRAIREEALTIIASNQGVDELDGYLKSRIEVDKRVGPVIHLNGSDGRQFMPRNWHH